MSLAERLEDKVFNWQRYKGPHDCILSVATLLLLLGWVTVW